MAVNLYSSPSSILQIHAVDEVPLRAMEALPPPLTDVRCSCALKLMHGKNTGDTESGEGGRAGDYHRMGRVPKVGRIKIKFLTIPDILLGKVSHMDLQKQLKVSMRLLFQLERHLEYRVDSVKIHSFVRDVDMVSGSEDTEKHNRGILLLFVFIIG